MILDSSAIVAILLQESVAERLLTALQTDMQRGVGSPTLVETGLVVGSRIAFENKRHILPRFLQTFGIQVLPFGELHWMEAVDAFERYGKGRHPASLNFGDCLTYAVAKLSGQALLCVGNDFPKTDLTLVPY